MPKPTPVLNLQTLKQDLDEPNAQIQDLQGQINALKSNSPQGRTHGEFYKELAEMGVGDSYNFDGPEPELRAKQTAIATFIKNNPGRLYRSMAAEGLLVITRFK